MKEDTAAPRERTSGLSPRGSDSVVGAGIGNLRKWPQEPSLNFT